MLRFVLLEGLLLEGLRVLPRNVQVFVHEKRFLLVAERKSSHIVGLFGGLLGGVLDIAELKLLTRGSKLTIHVLILPELVF